MHTVLKKGFYLFSLLLWLLVGLFLADVVLRLLASETLARFTVAPVVDAAHGKDDKAIAAALQQFVERPPFATPDQPSYEALATTEPSERFRYAAQRRELLLVCTVDGDIEHRYAPDNVPELAPILAWIAGSGNLLTALPAPQSADAQAFMQEVAKNDFAGPREYGLPRPGESPYCAEFYFQRLPAHAGKAPLLAIHVRPSVYAEIWSRYRPHVYRKNHIFEFSKSEFWTNAHGCRDDEVRVPKPPGVFRIVCIGGSTTLEGPFNSLTYPNFLERMLRAAFDTQQIEVVNCGVDALESPDERANLPHYLALEPDLILHYNFANDAGHVFNRALTISGSSLDQQRSLLSMLVRTRLLAYVLPAVRRLLLPDEETIGEALDAVVFANHRAITETAHAAGVHYAICSYAAPCIPWWNIPERGHLDRGFQGWSIPDYGVYFDLVQAYNRELRRFCRNTTALYVPVGEHLHGGLDTFTDNCHLHVHGIERKARLVFNALHAFIADQLQSDGRKGVVTVSAHTSRR